MTLYVFKDENGVPDTVCEGVDNLAGEVRYRLDHNKCDRLPKLTIEYENLADWNEFDTKYNGTGYCAAVY